MVVGTNVTGTLDFIQQIGRDMRSGSNGRILIIGPIAGFMPGSFQAVYNGTKAFLDSFSLALRGELRDSGFAVTCLMPGATETALSSGPAWRIRRSDPRRRTMPRWSPRSDSRR